MSSYPQVVRVFATTQEPDYDCPWQSLRASSSTGSGVLISSNQILTGAHVVANATFLQVQKNADPNKAIAHVKAVSHDCDLALLDVKNKNFFKGIKPAQIGDIPELRDKVSVVGFPVGGEEISITEGVVSRVEVQGYSHSQRKLLAVTVDAAINKGNSGGPVFKNGKVAGIAFQKLNNAENIGEMVPAPIIKRFLEGVTKEKNLSIPSLSIYTQKLENLSLRSKLGLGKENRGILVKSISYNGSAWGHLKPQDVLLEIDGFSIASNGTISYQDRYRTRYDVVLCQYYFGDQITLKILRGGKEKKIKLTLKPLQHLVPYSQYDTLPSYFVYGGLVFQPLTYNFLETWEDWWDKAPPEFLHYYYSGIRTKDHEEIVVLSQILSDEINLGYEELYNAGIMKVNGTKPENLLHLMQLIESSKKFVEIITTSHNAIILETAKVKKAHERILRRYNINEDRSENLKLEKMKKKKA